ncbi:MAG: hypothetical protein K8U57_01575 [Planctomycetes bacterium]|nr:hypothetical protein [Planctomycetota bacterium]
MGERCSRCLQLVPLGDNGRRPPWCPHCGVDYVPAPEMPPELQPLTLASGRPVAGGSLSSESGWLKIVMIVGGLMIAFAAFKMLDDWLVFDPDKPARETHQTHFRSARENRPASIEFTRGDRHISLTDPVEIALFLDLLSNAKQIHAHHSHSMNVVTFTCPALQDTYSFGRDSSIDGEYWLEVYQPDRPGPTKTRRVVHFASPEMKEWLQRTKIAALQE